MSTHGGRANEAGSLHRSGFAALLAAYGLRGLPLPFFGSDGSGPIVASLQFETADAVDDIRCNFTDGSYVVFQAKRSCGNGKHLAATVNQWVGQLESLGPSDKMGLVVRNAKGPVKHLKEALDNLRSEFPRQPTALMASALAAVQNLIPAFMEKRESDRLLRSIICIEGSCESPGDNYFENAVALLDSVIVAHGFGVVAVKVLQGNFQRSAASGLGSDLEDWVEWLQTGGLIPESNPLGPPGPRLAAQNLNLEQYLRSWQDQVDKLHYSLLAEDLPILEVEDLGRSYKAVIPSLGNSSRDRKSLLDVCRRWRRLLLVGLPGSGKSTAARQIAAEWARHDDAPIPLFVPLKRVAERVSDPSDVTLEILVEIGIAGTDVPSKESLHSAVMRHAQKGDVLLVLDGLDECRSLSGVVSNGISSLLERMHKDTSVVVVGRDSAIPAAKKLLLPEVRLCEPDFLERNMKSLLTAIADVRIPLDEREQWLSEKVRNIEESKDRNQDIWSVPLLATMLTLLTASRNEPSLPSSRAKILHSVVKDSVRKWELKRLSIQPPGGWDDSLKAPHLLDGFAAIGHAINEADSVDSSEVESALKLMLTTRWNCSAGEAEVLSQDIRWFWDEHVGVFVSVDAGKATEARSRQFTEIAEAIWVSQKNAEEVKRWVERAILDEEMKEALVLASGLSSGVAEILMDVSLGQSDIEARDRGILWLLQSEKEESSLSEARISRLIDELCRTYGDVRPPVSREHSAAHANGRMVVRDAVRRKTASQLKVDGFGWLHIVSMAQVGIPARVREIRDASFGSLALDGDRYAILNALTSLVDANYDQTPLNEEQIGAVRALLTMPIESAAKSGVQISRRRYSVGADRNPLLSGHREVGIMALPYLELLGEDVLPHLKVVAGRSPISQYQRFVGPLQAAGMDMTRSLARAILPLMELFEGEDFWSGILEPIAEMGYSADAIESHSSRDRRWRMPDLVALLELINVADVGVGEYRDATRDDASILPKWLTALTQIFQFDRATCAYQAQLVLDADEQSWSHDYDFLFTSMGEPTPESSDGELASLEALISCLRDASSDWVATISYVVLVNLGDVRAVPGLAEIIDTAAPIRKNLATIAWCASCIDGGDAAVRAFTSEDPAVREGAVSYARMVGSEAIILRELISAAVADPDGTIRWCATRDEAVSLRASMWSCPDCSHLNDMSVLDCLQCPTGTRPFG